MTNPYSSVPPVGGDEQDRPELARIELAGLKILNVCKDILLQVALLRSAVENESRRSNEFRAMEIKELKDMRQIIDKMTVTVEFLKSGLPVATASHGTVE